MSDLAAVDSEAIRAVVRMAVGDGNAVVTVAQWEKALVIHMQLPPGDDFKARVLGRYPGLSYFRTPGDPHNPADQGFMDGQFHVSFPIRGVWVR